MSVYFKKRVLDPARKPVEEVELNDPYAKELWLYPNLTKGLRGIVGPPTLTGTVTRKPQGVGLTAGRILYPDNDQIKGFTDNIAIVMTMAIPNNVDNMWMLGNINGNGTGSGNSIRLDSAGSESGAPVIRWTQIIGGSGQWVEAQITSGYVDGNIVSIAIQYDGENQWIGLYHHRTHLTYTTETARSGNLDTASGEGGLSVGSQHFAATGTWDLIQRVVVYEYVPRQFLVNLLKNPWSNLQSAQLHAPITFGAAPPAGGSLLLMNRSIANQGGMRQ